MEALLDNGGTLVLDGASGTLLEQLGVNLHPVLWSAEVVRSNENAVKDLHKRYFDAGANIITTLTYQASIPGYKDELGMSDSEAFLLMTRAVMLAKEVAVDAQFPLLRLVAAGLGPYGAYLHEGQEYTGNYGDVTEDTLRQFHAPRIAAVLAGDPDILLFETIPNKLELKVIAAILSELRSDVPVWISLSLNLSGESSVTLADGTPINELDPSISSVASAIGANCYPLGETDRVLKALKSLERPLIVYPNSGETYDGIEKTWTPSSQPAPWSIEPWIESGARVIGGCCRTSPDDIRKIADKVREYMRTHPPKKR